MSKKITNEKNIPLSMAVWLVDSTYDYISDPNYISATTLLKPTRQIILEGRVEASELNVSVTPDIADFIPRAVGNSVHNAIEEAWVKRYKNNLTKLGISENFIDIVKINPTEEEYSSHYFNVFIEQRAFMKIGNYTVGGKFDLVIDGQLEDNKTTSVWSYVKGSKADDYIKQGSIYRLANPKIITKNTVQINYIFTDWSGAMVTNVEGYPTERVLSEKYKLMSEEDTLKMITDKLNELDKYREADEKDIPYCTDEELWKEPDKYKYYRNPENVGIRATRNFDDYDEAIAYKMSKGKGEGVIITEHGVAKKCEYCEARIICSQYKELNPHLFLTE